MITTKEEIIWHRSIIKMESFDTNNFLKSRVCPENSSNIIKYLDIIKNKHNITKLEFQHNVNTFLYILTKHAINPTTQEYILEKFEELLKYLREEQNNSKLSDDHQNRVNIFLYIITKHTKTIQLLQYILNNFNEIKPK